MSNQYKIFQIVSREINVSVCRAIRVRLPDMETPTNFWSVQSPTNLWSAQSTWIGSTSNAPDNGYWTRLYRRVELSEIGSAVDRKSSGHQRPIVGRLEMDY